MQSNDKQEQTVHLKTFFVFCRTFILEYEMRCHENR